MKNVFILCSIVLFLSCSKSQDDACCGPMARMTNAGLFLYDSAGNNLFDPDTPNAINIKEVVVEQKIKGVYQVTQTGDANVTRQGGLTLYDKQQATADAFYINHRIILPDDYVIYVDLHAQKGTGIYEWYIDKACYRKSWSMKEPLHKKVIIPVV